MTRQAIISVLLAALVALLIAVFCAGYRCGQRRARSTPGLSDTAKVDTLYIRDTITETRPISVRFRIVDTIRVAAVDTVRVHDTLFVAMERQQVVWRDSLAEVYASGVAPAVDSVRHFRAAEVRTITLPPVEVIKRARWGIGIQTGYGATITGGKIQPAPYIGVGVSYNIFAW